MRGGVLKLEINLIISVASPEPPRERGSIEIRSYIEEVIDD